MNLVQSYSFPELLVSENGDVYIKETMNRLNRIENHAASTRGPVVSYKYKGRSKQISVLNLVFECHVKKGKMTKKDYFCLRDEDPNNVKATNLLEIDYKLKNTTKKSQERSGGYDCWMNGHDEVYI